MLIAQSWISVLLACVQQAWFQLPQQKLAACDHQPKYALKIEIASLNIPVTMDSVDLSALKMMNAWVMSAAIEELANNFVALMTIVRMEKFVLDSLVLSDVVRIWIALRILYAIETSNAVTRAKIQTLVAQTLIVW
jgi:hypothetical protein